MAYGIEVRCSSCRTGRVTMEIRGRFNNSEGLFCSPCGKRRLTKLNEIEIKNSKLELERPELRGKLR